MTIITNQLSLIIEEDVRRFHDDGVEQIVFEWQFMGISHPELDTIFDTCRFRPFARLIDHLIYQVYTQHPVVNLLRQVARCGPNAATDIQHILPVAYVAQFDPHFPSIRNELAQCN